MSHFTEIKTPIKDSRILKKALENLGRQFEHSAEGVSVRGFYGDVIPADFSIRTDSEYDLGLRQNAEGNFEFVADFEMLEAHKVNVTEIRNQIQQAYSQVRVQELLESQGYELGEQEVDQEGNIQMVVSKW